MTFYLLAIAGSICLVYAAIEIGRLVSRFVEDNEDKALPESAPPAPLVSYGVCCLPEGCKDYSDVDLEVAKADCENRGGNFKAFSKCSDGVCPEKTKESDKPAKKARQKSPPSSSMKVSRKGAKKAQKKKRDR